MYTSLFLAHGFRQVWPLCFSETIVKKCFIASLRFEFIDAVMLHTLYGFEQHVFPAIASFWCLFPLVFELNFHLEA